MIRRFNNRTEAGQLLAKQLVAYRDRADVLVLGLPRGGVPVAFEVAKVLHAPLDICLVRKLGVPGSPELAMGAIASGGVRILNPDVIEQLKISPPEIEAVATHELQELARREQCYRGAIPYPQIQNKIIILVDDGLATGSTMGAAIQALIPQNPREIVVVATIAPPSVCHKLKQFAKVSQVICLETPEYFSAISLWYEDFAQVNDQTVCNLLQKARIFREQ